MSEQKPDAAVIGAARDLRATLQETVTEVRRLRTYGRRNRWFIAVDVVLTVLLALTGAVSVHAVQAANSASAAQLALCRSGNVSRAQQIGIWEFLINLNPPPKTAQARKVLAAFEHHLKVTFAPRDCARLGHGH